MRVFLRLTLTCCCLLFANWSFLRAQEVARALPGAGGVSAMPVDNSNDDKDKNKKADKTAETAAPPELADPLVKLLVSKGVLSQSEASAIGGGTAVEGRDRLAALLLQKGLISGAEYETIRAPQQPAAVATNAVYSPSAAVASVAPQDNRSAPASKPAQTAPAVIPAITPLRVLQLEGAKRDGLIPDIKLGSGAKVKLYGFFKASAVYDSSNPPGNDFPLPGFLNDSGPDASPEFHIKARALRIGANFEWLDPAPNLTLTGKLEFDFEGDFTRVNNRNISAIRSSQPSIRLAWVRLDRTFNDKTGAYFLAGQDWTPFGSSTLPSTIETTGLHLGYGNIYQRAPQFRTGVNFLLRKKRNVRFQPEFAVVLPFFGNTPTNVADQLGYGERQGVDSRRPELQGRFVLQFQLDKAAGVAPAQLIASWTEGKRRAIVTRAGLDTATVGNINRAAFLAAFPRGTTVESSRYGYTAEFQLPTRYFTFIGKYYNGADLRAYFGGQLFSTFNDISGLTGVVGVPSIDGSATVAVGLRNGQPVIADQQGIRGQGGFLELGIPLSRLFNANPKGRNAGWTANLHYGYDEAKPRDVRQFLGATLNPIGGAAQSFGANRAKSDAAFANLQYKLNSFVTFALEQTYFRTRAANQAGFLPLFRGIPTRETHNNRTEFATIFTF